MLPSSPRVPICGVQSTGVVLGGVGVAAIAADPGNPNHIVAGANDYRVCCDFTGLNDGTGWAYTSFDGGLTWTNVQVPGLTAETGGQGQFAHVDSAGDPAMTIGPAVRMTSPVYRLSARTTPARCSDPQMSTRPGPSPCRAMIARSAVSTDTVSSAAMPSDRAAAAISLAGCAFSSPGIVIAFSAAACGASGEARSALTRSVDAGRAEGAEYEVGLALAALADLGEPDAAECRVESVEILRRLGVVGSGALS